MTVPGPPPVIPATWNSLKKSGPQPRAGEPQGIAADDVVRDRSDRAEDELDATGRYYWRQSRSRDDVVRDRHRRPLVEDDDSDPRVVADVGVANRRSRGRDKGITDRDSKAIGKAVGDRRIVDVRDGGEAEVQVRAIEDVNTVAKRAVAARPAPGPLTVSGDILTDAPL